MPAPASARVRPFAAFAPALLLLAAVVLVWHRALAHYFSQDDFVLLARATGLEPRLAGPWRLLSQQLLFDLLQPVAGLRPSAYHAVSLAVHAAVAVTLARLLAARLGAPAALTGATFFAAHAALFTAVFWIAAIGDSLACLFTLAAVALWWRTGPARWLAVPAFALALLSKESALPLPLALLALERPGAGPRGVLARLRDPLWIALAALATAAAVQFVASDAMGAARGSSAYAMGTGLGVLRNLLTYAGWAANPWLPTLRSFTDAPDPLVFPWAIAAIAAWGLGFASAALRRRGWFAAGWWFLVFLAPVLPLASHTYHYYLFLPLAGAAALVAIACDAALGGARAGAKPWAVAAALAVLFVANGRAVVRRIETAPLGIAGHLSDPILDRARIAQRLIESVRPALAVREPVRLMVWPLAPPGPGTTQAYLRDNLRSAVHGGVGLRVMLPTVIEARFTTAHVPLDPGWRWVLARTDGPAQVLTPAAFDSLVVRHGSPQ